MDAKTRAYWFDRQGLAGISASPREVLLRSGWARSVGGSNPYLTLFARARISKEAAERAVASLEIHELPSARGCTYYVPREDFALALRVGQGTGERAAINTATRYLGVTEGELASLEQGVMDALAAEDLDPKQLRDRLGGLVRNLGDEGKKRGQTTTLPLALGRLQAYGYIRRVAMNGRLDSERYRYALWRHNPLAETGETRDEAMTRLARKFWQWIGPARPKDFQWFSGLGVGATAQAIAPLGLVETADGFMILPDEQEAFSSFEIPRGPCYALVSAIDAMFLLRRDAGATVDEADALQRVQGEKGLIGVGGIQDLSHNGILDRGRLVGLWEFDPEAGEIVYKLFRGPDDDLLAVIGEAEAFIRDELGDARSFSLDSPASRKPAIEYLRREG